MFRQSFITGEKDAAPVSPYAFIMGVLFAAVKFNLLFPNDCFEFF
jgi:hypothetical protein